MELPMGEDVGLTGKRLKATENVLYHHLGSSHLGGYLGEKTKPQPNFTLTICAF